MDRFVVKTPRTSGWKPRQHRSTEESAGEDLRGHGEVSGQDREIAEQEGNPGPSSLSTSKDVQIISVESRQCTIHSLQGVVVVEDIKRWKSKLDLPNQSTPVLLETLRHLGHKVPPRHVLLSTKLGHSVRRMKKHPNPDVAKAAKQVYMKWRTFFEAKREKPLIEVKCDRKAEDLRLRARTFLSEALELERSHPLIEAVERESFHLHQRRVSPAYRRSMRNMVFKLKNSPDLRASLLSGSRTVEQFVKDFKKS